MSRTIPDTWVENRPTHGLAPVRLDRLWEGREIALALAGRDFRVRYKQAALGVAWAAIQPLLGLVVFTFVFDRLADVPTDGVPYPLFAIVGIAAWNYHSAALHQVSQALVSNSSLITKVYFPRLLAPLAAALTPLVDLAVSLGIVAVMLVAYGHAPTWWALPLLPVAAAFLLLTTLGPSLTLAALNVQYRDVRQVVGPLLQVWLFASPVAYPATLVDGRYRWAYALNPMVGVLEVLRGILLGQSVDPVLVAMSALTCAALLAVGLVVFGRSERRFADVI